MKFCAIAYLDKTSMKPFCCSRGGCMWWLSCIVGNVSTRFWEEEECVEWRRQYLWLVVMCIFSSSCFWSVNDKSNSVIGVQCHTSGLLLHLSPHWVTCKISDDVQLPLKTHKALNYFFHKKRHYSLMCKIGGVNHFPLQNSFCLLISTVPCTCISFGSADMHCK